MAAGRRWRAAGALLLLALAAARQCEAARTMVDEQLRVEVAARALLGASDHKYQTGEEVPLWASKVGPFTNPRCLVGLRTSPVRADCARTGVLGAQSWGIFPPL